MVGGQAALTQAALTDGPPRTAPAVVTYGLIALLTALFIAGLIGSPILRQGFVRNEMFGLVPAWLTGVEARPDRFDLVPVWATPVSAVLFHAGIVPLLASLLVLETFGPIVERVLGSIPTTLLLVLAAYGSGLLQAVVAPPHTPMLGAAATLAGLVGAALMLCGRRWMRVSIEPFGGLRLPAAFYGLIGLVLLWEGAHNPMSPDLIAPPGWEACFAGFICGLASAGLWLALERSHLWKGKMDRDGALEQVRLRLFPLLLVLSAAVPPLLRLMQFR